ncbi:hypothetical protein M0R72_01610 [Candidatus Pacearchaeota archaeon]|jgi:hypothetical protein|nr:hypothetical protein [Candidatus Pacearchaeota archaeon]
MSVNHQHENIRRRFWAEREAIIKGLRTFDDSTDSLTRMLALLSSCSRTIIRLLQLPAKGFYDIVIVPKDLTTIDITFEWKGPNALEGKVYLGFISLQGNEATLHWEKISGATGAVSGTTTSKLEFNEASVLGALADVIVDRRIMSSLALIIKDPV